MARAGTMVFIISKDVPCNQRVREAAGRGWEGEMGLESGKGRRGGGGGTLGRGKEKTACGQPL